MKKYFLTRLRSIFFMLVGVTFIPYLLCSSGADDFFNDDLQAQLALQNGVELWVMKDLNTNDYSTGSTHFNGEWLFGTYMMAGMGFGQMAILHPELKEKNIILLEKCIEKILTEDVKDFDKSMWGEDPFEAEDGTHAAYLGYLNLLLSLNHYINPDSRYNALNDRLTGILADALKNSKIYALETYPQEIYPVDNYAVIASIGLYDKATGNDHSHFIRQAVEHYRQRYIDKDTGLLVQSIGNDGEWLDHSRGSGTTLGLYFLSFAFPDVAKSLYDSVKNELASSLFNFGVVREYPQGVDGYGDIDTGPVVLGYGFSATGFAIAGSKIFRDNSYFKKLYAISYLIGAPYEKDGALTYITGGPIGTAILFAMFTALSEGTI